MVSALASESGGPGSNPGGDKVKKIGKIQSKVEMNNITWNNVIKSDKVIKKYENIKFI